MKVLILGLGISGAAAADFLRKFGNDVSIYDDNPDVLSSHSSSYQTYNQEEFYEMAVISPGMATDHPVVKELKQKGTEILGEMELAGRYLSDEKIIAVTGTNGKSTTVSVTYAILKEAGYKVFLCGNIGEPVIEGVGKGYDFLVIEISSFQLETLKSIKPDVSMILNVTPDHLDRYPSYEEYLLTKVELAKLTKQGGLLILNGGDEPLVAACSHINVEKKYFSAYGTGDITFNNGMIYSGNSELKIDDLPLKGLHNVENIMASLLGVCPYVSDINIVRSALKKFKPLSHRTEFVDEFEGVVFIDDSKGTNVGAVEMSLAGFEDGMVVLILGGVDKGGSYEPLRKLAEKKCKGVVLIGDAKETIKGYFLGFEGLVEADSMYEAVEKAYNLAGNNATVLLSPACSSYDWYRNYKERGNDFRNRVMELKRSILK